MILIFEKYNKLSWLITILLTLLIFYMSSLTFLPAVSVSFDIKSTAYHFLVFFWLAFFLLISLIKGNINNKRTNLFIYGLIFVLLYSISDEIHQLFVPGRFCSLTDILIDSIGIFLATLIYLNSFKTTFTQA